MSRELMLAVLACLLCVPALLAAGAIEMRLPAVASARELERRAWQRVWLPVWPAVLVLAFLIGWAVQEPEASEGAEPAMLAVASLFALSAVRAVARAARALRRPARGAVAMTAGLVRPHVFIAPELAARLDEQALGAALAHEEAHVRHRDPLRLWLAQIATDLQWPLVAARQRFTDWRNALELARDAEACEHVEGSDLAAALIEAARLSRATPGVVGLVGGPDAFSERIHRLLDAPHDAGAAPGRRWAWAIRLGVVGLAVAAGSLFGEALVGFLPGFD